MIISVFLVKNKYILYHQRHHHSTFHQQYRYPIWSASISLDGKGPIYRNVTKEYTPQIAKAEGKNFAAAAGKEGVGESRYQIVPPTDEIRNEYNAIGLDQKKIDDIVKALKSEKPRPETYLDKIYINRHLQSFRKTGVVKIMRSAPSGTIGGTGGTFVMSGDQLEYIIKSCSKDISKIEKMLGFDKGYLGDNPVIVEINNVSGLRMPMGNELGADPKYWLPGGYTIGGIKEAVIDPAPIGSYTYRYLK